MEPAIIITCASQHCAFIVSFISTHFCVLLSDTRTFDSSSISKLSEDEVVRKGIVNLTILAPQ
jgi:hypothetical protein